MSIQKLHYENLGGMLIRREGLLNWRCPLCKAEGQSREVMRVCPKCGSKEAILPVAQPALDVTVLLRRAAMALEVVGTEWRESDPTLRLDLASALAAAPEAKP